MAQSESSGTPPIAIRTHESNPRIPADAETEPTDAGTLVYRPTADGLGRELAGFLDDVADWSAMRDELIRRGKSVGALYHLPTYRR